MGWINLDKQSDKWQSCEQDIGASGSIKLGELLG